MSKLGNVRVRKNSGAIVGTRRMLNFREGDNVVLTITDDPIGDEIDILIAAAAAGGGRVPATTYIYFDGGDYLVIDATDGATLFTRADPAVALEDANNIGGYTFLQGQGERWTLATEPTIDANDWVLHGGGVGSPELYVADGTNDDVLNIPAKNIYVGWVDMNGNRTNQTEDAGASENATQRGVRVSGDNVHLYKNYIHHIAQHCITYQECEGGSAYGNLCTLFGWNGIFSYRLGTPGYGQVYYGNEVSHGSDVGMGMYGSRVNIFGNYIHDMDGTTGSGNTQWGAGIEGGDWNKINNNVIDDVLTGIATARVNAVPVAEDPQFWEICDNTITGQTAGAGGHAIYIKARNGKCWGNTIDEIPAWTEPNNWVVGILVDDPADEATGNLFGNNTFNGPGAYCGYQIIDEYGNSFEGDRFLGIPNYAYYLQDACHRTVITNPKIWDCQHGIFFDDGAQSDNCVIDGGFINSASVVGINAQNTDGLSVLNVRMLACLLGVDMSNAASVKTFMNGCNFYGSTNAVNSAGSTNPQWGTNADHDGVVQVGAEP